MAVNQTGNKIQTLRTDNGLEFANKDMNVILEKYGIIHQKTVAYSPEQNGKVERENRTVVEAARTMLKAKNLKKNLWAEAVNTAVYVINRSAKSGEEKKTPYEVWTNKKFDINTLQVFGSEVYVHVPKEKRKKWDAKGEKGIFVGYGENTKGYRIYFHKKQSVEVKRDVVFLDKKKVNEGQLESIVELPEQVTKPEGKEEEGNDRVEKEQPEPEQPDGEVEIESQTTDQRGRIVKKPAWLEDYDTSLLTAREEPITYEEAVTGENKDKWIEAINNELGVLHKNKTWDEVQWPVNKKVV